MIGREVIEAVLDRTDIVRLVEGCGVELRRSGRGWVGRCPFHEERTGSFHVSAERQRWHCFGQCQRGGNAIDFVMLREGLGFPEAVRRLAAACGVEVEEREESAEEIQGRLRREAMLGLNARAAAWFAERLWEAPGRRALDYARGRWGEEYVREAGLGWAPEGFHGLLDWASARGENLELMVELGLLRRKEETGRLYDFFRGRLVIPIRDRAGRVTGFTARDLTGAAGAPKYVNSPESAVYRKGESVWGLDAAAHEAAREEKFYLVEGAADAMKMQSVGIGNAVAPLGGSWTAEQLRLLRRTARGVCLINDADPVPEGGRWGAGVEFVLKNGELALREGLQVSVRELPCLKGNLKQDPGDFFTSSAALRRLEEEDFVVWAAGKLYSKDDGTTERLSAVRRVAGLLSLVGDGMRVEYILPDICKLTRGKRDMYMNLVRELRAGREAEGRRKRGEVDLRQYGFWEEGGRSFGYWGRTEKGGEVRWSNFTMRPLFHVRDKEKEKSRRLFWLKNELGDEELVEMTMEEMNSPVKFRQRIEAAGSFLWMAGDRDMVHLKHYLFNHTERAQLVRRLGWNGRGGFYAWGNGLYAGGEFCKADEFGVVRLEGNNWYIPAASRLSRDEADDDGGASYERERKFVHLGLQTVNAGEYLRDFAAVWGDNGKVGLMYWVASLFRDVVVAHTDKFPLLDLFGPKGSGKSQMGSALMSFFVTDYKAPNIQNASPAALAWEVASTSCALAHLDEYKNDMDERRVDFLKALYDGRGRMKMTGPSYDQVEMQSVRSGVVISGQELPTKDIALFHRCVFLSFPRSTFTPEERRRFEALRQVQRMGLTGLTMRVLDLRKKFEASFPESYDTATEDLRGRLSELGRTVETRLLENWAKTLGAWRAVSESLPWPMTYGEMLEKCARMLAAQDKMCGEGNELGRFWETLQFLHDTGDLYAEGDFLLRERTELRTDQSERRFAAPTRLLYLNTSRVFTLYRQAMLRSGSKPLPDDALREYLKNAPYHLGRKMARFRVIIDGVERHAKDPLPGRDNTLHSPRRAMVFDYGAITRAYGISLDTLSGPAGDPSGPEAEAPERGREPEPLLPF